MIPNWTKRRIGALTSSATNRPLPPRESKNYDGNCVSLCVEVAASDC